MFKVSTVGTYIKEVSDTEIIPEEFQEEFFFNAELEASEQLSIIKRALIDGRLSNRDPKCRRHRECTIVSREEIEDNSPHLTSGDLSVLKLHEVIEYAVVKGVVPKHFMLKDKTAIINEVLKKTGEPKPKTEKVKDKVKGMVNQFKVDAVRDNAAL